MIKSIKNTLSLIIAFVTIFSFFSEAYATSIEFPSTTESESTAEAVPDSFESVVQNECAEQEPANDEENGLVPADSENSECTIPESSIISEQPDAEDLSFSDEPDMVYYSIVYELGGGINSDLNPDSYSVSDNDIVFLSPFRPGYTFAGWFSNKELTKKITRLTAGTSGDRIIYAAWTANKYKINFVPNNTYFSENYPLAAKATGSMQPISVTYDKPKSLTANVFKRKGYHFVGWSLRPDGEADFSDNEKVLNLTVDNNSTVKLYAVWKENSYTLSIEGNGSVYGENYSVPLRYTDVFTAPEYGEFEKTGYTQSGWTYKKGSSTVTVKAGNELSALSSSDCATVHLKAKWTANKYSVIFDSNGGTGTAMKNLSCTYGTAKALISNTYKRSKYTFTGWNTEPDGSGVSYKNQASVKNLTSEPGGLVTLYAQWKPVSYKISYVLNGGTNSVLNPASYTIETSGIILQPPAKKGYTFSGWYTDSKLKIPVSDSSSVFNGGAKTFYAKWQRNSYRVEFNANGGTGTMPGMLFSYDNARVLVANGFTHPKNYVFSGWNTEPDGSGKTFENKASVKNLCAEADGLVILYAQWDKSDYSVYRSKVETIDNASLKTTILGTTYNGTPQMSRLGKSGKNYYKITGICNFASMETLINRYIAYKYDDYSWPFTNSKLFKALGCTVSEGPLIYGNGIGYVYSGDTETASRSFSYGTKTLRWNYVMNYSRSDFLSLLEKHPEGVYVHYSYGSGYHAVVITSYKKNSDGSIRYYAIDPANVSSGSGVQAFENTWIYSARGGGLPASFNVGYFS